MERLKETCESCKEYKEMHIVDEKGNSICDDCLREFDSAIHTLLNAPDLNRDDISEESKMAIKHAVNVLEKNKR